jgi:hypothetical protein
MRDSAYCLNHDPSRAEENRRRGSKGGRRAGRGRPSAELKRLQERFEELAEKVLKKKAPRGDVAVAIQALAQARACVRDGLLAREHEGLIQEVEEMRREWEQQKERKHRYG